MESEFICFTLYYFSFIINTCISWETCRCILVFRGKGERIDFFIGECLIIFCKLVLRFSNGELGTTGSVVWKAIQFTGFCWASSCRDNTQMFFHQYRLCFAMPMDNASTSYALMMASSSLLKQVTDHSLPLQLRLEIRNILYFLIRNKSLHNIFVTHRYLCPCFYYVGKPKSCIYSLLYI